MKAVQCQYQTVFSGKCVFSSKLHISKILLSTDNRTDKIVINIDKTNRGQVCRDNVEPQEWIILSKQQIHYVLRLTAAGQGWESVIFNQNHSKICNKLCSMPEKSRIV